MLLTFRCPPDVKERVNELIKSGLYPDFSAFCLAAIENQLLLEETHAKHEGMAESQESQEEIRTPKIPAGDAQRLSSLGLAERLQLLLPRDSDLALGKGESIRQELALERLDAEPPLQLPAGHSDLFKTGEWVPIDRWLFGQYNRLLPAKIAMRALAVMTADKKESLLLEEIASRIAEIAARFGAYLEGLDRRFETHRDDALATAFPDPGPDGLKARLRFQNHFVGHTIKGEQGGLLVGLKLAEIRVRRNKYCILPTLPGWHFARMPNPLLDDKVSETPTRFSEEEIAFLLQHIQENLPVERFALQVVLSLLAQGNTTPESLTNRLAKYLRHGRQLSEHQDYVSTQRTGVLGRASDLGLIKRERNARYITYNLTPKGSQFLSDLGGAPDGVQKTG
jgi:hypothetical protein